jgi:PadR family transcriptional regulator, regulatory protein PadR
MRGRGPGQGFEEGRRGEGGGCAPGRGTGRGMGGGRLLEAAVLASLALEPAHGYDLRKAAEELSSGFVCADPGGTYRLLRRLEQEGFVRSTWSEGEHGPQRREYELTGEGRELLAQWGEHLRQRERAFRSVIEAIDRAIKPGERASGARTSS